MEVVALRTAEPTHRVIHVPRQLDAYIYIAQSLQEKLASPNQVVRLGAQSSVAINFRNACQTRHGRVPGRFVEFSDLEITVIDRTPELPFQPMTHGGEPIDYDDGEE